MKLNITPLSQRDPRWKDQRLGMKNGTTIGSDGCVVVSASMLYTYYGKPTTPDQLDNFLTDNKLYYDETGDGPANDNLWVPNNVSKWLAGMKFEKVIKCPDPIPAPIVEIKSNLDQGKPVFVWLMNNGVFHCTLAIGYEDNEIIVNDPWKGDTVRIDQRWGQSAEKIIEVDFYSGPVASHNDSALQSCLTQHTALVTEIEGVKKEYKEASNAWSIERASLKQNIVNRDETISRVEKQVTETKKAWDTDREALIKTITESEKGTATLKDAIGTLEKRLKNEEAERHALATINAELEAKNAGLIKQISDNVVDYKTLSLKERIKVCVDILFT